MSDLAGVGPDPNELPASTSGRLAGAASGSSAVFSKVTSEDRPRSKPARLPLPESSLWGTGQLRGDTDSGADNRHQWTRPWIRADRPFPGRLHRNPGRPGGWFVSGLEPAQDVRAVIPDRRRNNAVALWTSALEIQVSSLGSQVSTLRSEISHLRSLVLTSR